MKSEIFRSQNDVKMGYIENIFKTTQQIVNILIDKHELNLSDETTKILLIASQQLANIFRDQCLRKNILEGCTEEEYGKLMNQFCNQLNDIRNTIGDVK
jgi:hypothetical protein